FNSGASQVSIPILNAASIPQVSPANTYIGLTRNLPGSAPGEPQKFYPSGKRTYLRIVPIDSIQAAADLIAMKEAGCTKVAVAKVFGGDGVCTDSYTNATKGGIPASLYPLTQCTVATQDLAAYPGGKDFLTAYKAKYGVANPDAYAIYGYEAMKLGLDTVK